MSERASWGRASRLARTVAIVVLVLSGLAWSPASGKREAPSTHRDGPQVAYLFGSGSTHGGRPITLRIKLTGPAPSGGADVILTSERPEIIPVPGTVTVPEGETSHTLSVGTVPTDDDTYVRISASFGGRTVGREVLIREPRLRALYAQQVIRGGGQGKVTVCLTGPAPVAGIAVDLESSNATVLQTPSTIDIQSGRACRSIAAPAAAVEQDTLVTVTAAYKGETRTRDTIVRDLGEVPTATATGAPPSPTATSTVPPSTSTATGTMSPTATATATTVPPTLTATASATATATTAPPTPTATNTLVPPTETPVPPTATATTSTEGLSVGCALFAQGAFDGNSNGGSTMFQSFNAGERIQLTVSDVGGADTFTFTYDGDGDPQAQTKAVPGFVTFVVPVTEVANTFWSTSPNGTVVTWDFTCLPPLP